MVLASVGSLVAGVSEISFSTRFLERYTVFFFMTSPLGTDCFVLSSRIKCGWAGYCSSLLLLRELFYCVF